MRLKVAAAVVYSDAVNEIDQLLKLVADLIKRPAECQKAYEYYSGDDPIAGGHSGFSGFGFSSLNVLCGLGGVSSIRRSASSTPLC